MKKFHHFLLAILIFSILIAGCSTNEVKAITDIDTQQEVDEIVLKDNIGIMFIKHYPGEDMENLSLQKGYLYFKKDIVVNTEYSSKDISRGDVIHFETPAFTWAKNPNLKETKPGISRIVALPGEKIKVEKGRIYINGKKLDAFYGGYRNNGGVSLDNFVDIAKEHWTKEQKEKIKNEIESFNMDQLTVPEGHVYVINDNWFRGIDSKMFGSVPIKNIKGKVLGVLRK